MKISLGHYLYSIVTDFVPGRILHHLKIVFPSGSISRNTPGVINPLPCRDISSSICTKPAAQCIFYTISYSAPAWKPIGSLLPTCMIFLNSICGSHSWFMLFTLRGARTWTSTGNRTRTTGDNGSWFLSLSRTSVNILHNLFWPTNSGPCPGPAHVQCDKGNMIDVFSVRGQSGN